MGCIVDAAALAAARLAPAMRMVRAERCVYRADCGVRVFDGGDYRGESNGGFRDREEGDGQVGEGGC